jgi:hypothetical protein
MKNVYICRKKSRVSKTKEKGDLVVVPGEYSLENLVAKIGVVSGVVYVDDLGIMSEIEGKVLDWDRGWDTLNALLIAGNRIQLVKESIYIDSPQGVVAQAFQGVSGALKELRKHRQAKSVGSYKEKMINGENPSNWKLPDKEFIGLLVNKVKVLGVGAACKELGISKQSYYNWKRKNLF